MSQSVDITSDFTGRKGAVVTSDTNAVVGPFVAVQVLVDAVFADFSETNCDGLLVGLSLPAGLVIHGNIIGYTLASGAVRAYKA